MKFKTMTCPSGVYTEVPKCDGLVALRYPSDANGFVKVAAKRPAPDAGSEIQVPHDRLVQLSGFDENIKVWFRPDGDTAAEIEYKVED